MMARFKRATRYLCGAFYVVAGLNHFFSADFYRAMMPPYLPWPIALVYVSGVAEAMLGALLFFRGSSRLAAWGLIALLVAVFPANVHMALHPELFPSLSTTVLWLRLPLQGVLIAWAFWYTRADRSLARSD